MRWGQSLDSTSGPAGDPGTLTYAEGKEADERFRLAAWSGELHAGDSMGRTSSAEEIAVAQLTGGRERRKQHRFACAGPAEVLGLESRTFYRGEIKDLSLTGCYITNGTAEIELDSHADVHLCLSANGDPLEASARVIMVRPDSGGLSISSRRPQIREALLTVIRKLADQTSSTPAIEVV